MAGPLGSIASGLTGRIPNIPVVVGELRVWLDLTRRGIDAAVAALDGLVQETTRTLKSIGFQKWAKYWHVGRQLISLQQRLLLEQIYSDMGEPWSDLITGFGPLARVGLPSFGERLRAERDQLEGARHSRQKTSKRTTARRRRDGT